MNMKYCQFCHAYIKKVARRCPECKRILYKQYLWAKNPFKNRNEEMIRLLETGDHTLSEVGAAYHISRERARQIYRKMTGKPYTEQLKRKREKKRESQKQQEQEFLQTLKFYCARCQKPVTQEEGHALKKFCRSCKNLIDLGNNRRAWTITNVCKNCGKDFHPYSNMKNMIFCKNHCYFAYQKTHPRRFKTDKFYSPRINVLQKPTVIFRINGRIVKGGT